MLSYLEIHRQFLDEFNTSYHTDIDDNLFDNTSLTIPINVSSTMHDIMPDPREVDMEIVRVLSGFKGLLKMVDGELFDLTKTSVVKLNGTDVCIEFDTTTHVIQLMLESRSLQEMSKTLYENPIARNAIQLVIANLSERDTHPEVSIDTFWPSDEGTTEWSSVASESQSFRVWVCLKVCGDFVGVQLSIGLPGRDSDEYAAMMRMKALATISCMCSKETVTHFTQCRKVQNLIDTHFVGSIEQPISMSDINYAVADSDDVSTMFFLMHAFDQNIDRIWKCVRESDYDDSAVCVRTAAKLIAATPRAALRVVFYKRTMAQSLTNLIDSNASLDLLEMLCRSPCIATGQPTPYWKTAKRGVDMLQIHPQAVPFYENTDSHVLLHSWLQNEHDAF
jgi:hypothetical protein